MRKLPARGRLKFVLATFVVLSLVTVAMLAYVRIGQQGRAGFQVSASVSDALGDSVAITPTFVPLQRQAITGAVDLANGGNATASALFNSGSAYSVFRAAPTLTAYLDGSRIASNSSPSVYFPHSVSGVKMLTLTVTSFPASALTGSHNLTFWLSGTAEGASPSQWGGFTYSQLVATFPISGGLVTKGGGNGVTNGTSGATSKLNGPVTTFALNSTTQTTATVTQKTGGTVSAPICPAGYTYGGTSANGETCTAPATTPAATTIPFELNVKVATCPSVDNFRLKTYRDGSQAYVCTDSSGNLVSLVPVSLPSGTVVSALLEAPPTNTVTAPSISPSQASATVDASGHAIFTINSLSSGSSSGYYYVDGVGVVSSGSQLITTVPYWDFGWTVGGTSFGGSNQAARFEFQLPFLSAYNVTMTFDAYGGQLLSPSE